MAFPQRSYGNSQPFNYDPRFQPFNYDPRFTSELYRYGGPDLSASLNGLHAAQGLGFSGTREAYVTTWCDSGFLSPSTFRLPRSKAQSTVPPISPFPTDLEVSTLNPSVDLQRVPFGSDDSNSMSSISLASPGSARSDTTLPGNVNTIVISPDICLLTPRASTPEGTIDMTAAGSSNDNVCELERTPTMSEARSRIRISTENASMASTDQPGKLNYKRKHDLISSSSVHAETMKSKRIAKHKPPQPPAVMPNSVEPSIAPAKRRPGRPLSTSSTARAIVRDLAALHVKDNRKEARTPDESSRMAFDQFLPPFPEVSAYIGEQNTSTLLGIIAEEEPDVADSGPVDTIGEIVHRLPQTNKVAAKKHRELIKERTKNLEDVNAWMDQALIEYERRNSRLLDTIARLRKENEALQT